MKTSELAGKTVKHKATGKDYRVEDYWVNVGGKPWKEMQNSNPACAQYAQRMKQQKLPDDDNVLYGKIGSFGHLVHESEIDSNA